MIEAYSFGTITINGKTFTNDIEVHASNKEILSWWRNESHVIDIDAIKRAIAFKPTTIVIGTGASGVAEVLDETIEHIKSKNIKVIIEKTGDATKTFDALVKDAKAGENIVGLFHLTC